jgi:class 3 adenylate cyclase/DNA-binding transcriptional MerR regulator
MDLSEIKAVPPVNISMPRIVTTSPSDPGRDLSADKIWLTGSEVLEQTGITKRDLVGFIQRGVLPTLMMRISTEGGKKSYFSASVLERLRVLKRLRDEGHSMDETVRKFRETSDDTPRPVHHLKEEGIAGESAPQPAASSAFHLAADADSTTIIFVDKKLQVGWIQVGQADHLAAAIQDEHTKDPCGSVFDIMLRASLKELVFNWQPLLTFTYRFLEGTTSADTFRRLAPTISLKPVQLKIPTVPSADLKQPPNIDSCPIRLEGKDGRMRDMRIYALSVVEGTLLFLDAEHGNDDHRKNHPDRTACAPPADAEDAVGKKPFSVLAARLDESRSIVETLLPETYFKLMTRIWDECDRVLAAYGGARAKRSGTDVQYIIPRRAAQDPAYDAIRCAVKLRDKMREIEVSLNADEGWIVDLRLNIGISSGRDYLQGDDPTASMAFMLPGGAADQAFHLSAISQRGAIWITKSAFSHLSSQQVQRIIFGIYRGKKLIRNIFAPLAELWQAPDAPPLGSGIRSLSVTRIIGLQPQAARPTAGTRR